MKQAIEGLRDQVAEAVAAMRRDPQPEPAAKLFDVRDWRFTPAIAVIIVGWMIGGAWWCWTLQGDVRDLKEANASYKEDRVKYREGIARDLVAVRDSLSAIPNLTYRVAQLETVGPALNARIDRGFDVVNSRLDTNAKNGSDVSGDVKAMRLQIDSLVRAVDRLEASRGGAGPFGRDQSWPFPTPRLDPFVLRASTECRMLSPIVGGRV